MPRAKHFGEFKDHTLLKHYLLESYVKAWATILMTRGGFRRVWFVDAFAGAGCDSQGRDGSPLIAAKIAEAVNREAFPEGITIETGMHVLAIEADRDRYARLVQCLEPYTSRADQLAIVREGTLDERLDKFLQFVKQDPVLYFLDPFGIDGLSTEVLDRVLRAPRSEVLALFADEGAVRLYGKVTAEPDEGREVDLARAQTSLLGEEDHARSVAEAEQRARRRAAGHKSNPRAEEILKRALGGDWWMPLIDTTPPEARQRRFRDCYVTVLRQHGASYVLPFSVDTDQGRHKYFLLHGSKQAAAFVAMKDAMDRARKRQAERRGTVTLLGELIVETDIGEAADRVAAHFAGRTVRWTGLKPLRDSVKGFALEATDIWMHELEALQAEFVRRGWARMEGRAQAYAFPPATP